MHNLLAKGVCSLDIRKQYRLFEHTHTTVESFVKQTHHENGKFGHLSRPTPAELYCVGLDLKDCLQDLKEHVLGAIKEKIEAHSDVRDDLEKMVVKAPKYLNNLKTMSSYVPLINEVECQYRYEAPFETYHLDLAASDYFGLIKKKAENHDENLSDNKGEQGYMEGAQYEGEELKEGGSGADQYPPQEAQDLRHLSSPAVPEIVSIAAVPAVMRPQPAPNQYPSSVPPLSAGSLPSRLGGVAPKSKHPGLFLCNVKCYRRHRRQAK